MLINIDCIILLSDGLQGEIEMENTTKLLCTNSLL